MGRVLVSGHVNWDVTLRVDRFPEADGEASIRAQHRAGGGSAANVAAALSGLDHEAVLVGSVGDDENGRRARGELEDAGVSLAGVRVVEGGATTVKYLLVDADGEVAVLGNDGANEAVGPADVDAGRIRASDHVHLTSQRPDTAAEIARIASETDVTVSFDPGRRLADRDYGAALAVADIVFANDRERAALLEDESVGSSVTDRVLVVKQGADGAEVHTPTTSYVHPGFDVQAVDTTGAGDAFAAGFIASVLADEDAERALEYANACGALTAKRTGARTAPTADAVAAFLGDGP